MFTPPPLYYRKDLNNTSILIDVFVEIYYAKLVVNVYNLAYLDVNNVILLCYSIMLFYYVILLCEAPLETFLLPVINTKIVFFQMYF